MTGDMDGLASTLERVWKLAWWALLLRGLIAIAFGIMALIWPTDSLVALVLVYGAYMLVDGVFSIVGAFSSDTSERWWLVASGVLSVAAGGVAIAWPGLTVIVLVMIIGFWSIVRGVIEIAAAIRLRKVIPNEWMLIAAGAISVLVGILLAVSPLVGALTLIWVVGFWSVGFGILMIALAFRVRAHRRRAGGV
ncbi:MAG TPA: HdeD family acid-resistance protein [Hyphomonadaceae bacterium]|nr:HdeD family acid-resistance protein [Hyphomonadaceae bacterium]